MPRPIWTASSPRTEIGSGGTGLIGLHDRIGAFEGSLFVSSPRGGPGTTLIARIPLPD